MNALRALVAPVSHAGRFFAGVKVTGTHATCIAMMQSGAADIAAIDCVTHAQILRHRGEALAGTQVLGCSVGRTRHPAPAVPYVTRTGLGDDSRARMRCGPCAHFHRQPTRRCPQNLTVRQHRDTPRHQLSAHLRDSAACGAPRLSRASLANWLTSRRGSRARPSVLARGSRTAPARVPAAGL